MKGEGCDRCAGSGYKGRMGLHEVMNITDDLRLLIYKKSKGSEFRELSMANGMKTLMQDGVWKVVNGSTDLKEVKSVCMR